MKLLFLFGNSAVGKMTVGQELAKITPLRLMHNHHMIEPVLEIFGQFRGDIIQKLRFTILEEFTKTDNYGLIFTYMMAFDMPSEYEYLKKVIEVLGVAEEDVCYAELVAPQDIRLKRNVTENRLKHKASKRDVDASNARLIRDDENHRMESLPGEITWTNYLRIDNSHLSPAETAKIIKERFGFPDA
jgi:shikimate kinase